MIVYSSEWLTILFQKVSAGVLYSWMWVGQPAILLACILFLAARRDVSAFTVMLGCAVNVVGRVLNGLSIKLCQSGTTRGE